MAKKRRSSKTRTTTKRRTRRASRVRRATRRVRSSTRRFAKKRGRSIVSTITNFIPVVASIQLLTHNQMSALGTNASMGDKVKTLINGFTGSIFDQNLFSDVPQAHFNFSIEGMFNQWTAIAIGTWIGGAVGKKFGIPKSAMLCSLGKKLLMPALVTGSLGIKNNESSGGISNPFFQQGSTTVQTTAIRTSSISPSSGGIA